MIGHTNETTSIELDNVCNDIFEDSMYGGIWSANDVEIDNIKKDQFMIVNTDNNDKPGIHWILLYRDKKVTYFYDSYRRKYQTLNPLWKHKKWKQYINVPEQSLVSSICGHICIAMMLTILKYGVMSLRII